MLKKPIILSKYGFNIGDNVTFVNEIDPDDGVVRGQTGTICTFEGAEEDCVGVRWDKDAGYYHSCSGYCEDRRGWYVPYHGLIKTNNLIDLGEIDAVNGAIDALYEILV